MKGSNIFIEQDQRRQAGGATFLVGGGLSLGADVEGRARCVGSKRRLPEYDREDLQPMRAIIKIGKQAIVRTAKDAN